MKVVISAKAENDLQDIGDWIAQENNVRAISFVRELRSACEALADMPRAFPLLARSGKTRVRRKPFRSYLIFYRIGKERVEVLHVVHAARDYEKIVFAD